MVCLCIIIAGFGLVIYNLFNIQIRQGDFYQQRAIAQQLRTTPITANRRTIYDRNGNTLAVSATVWTVLFSPHDITDEQAVVLADGMSEILGVDREFVIEKAKNKKNYYQIVKRRWRRKQPIRSSPSLPSMRLQGSASRRTANGTIPMGVWVPACWAL